MPVITDDTKVSSMTVGELKAIIKNVIVEFIDPDFGLELRSDVEKALKNSIASKERIPAEKVAEELGLNW